MKKALALLVISFALLPLTSTILSALSAEATTQQRSERKKLSKKQVKWLNSNARTASEHEMLATYYRARAERLTKKSREHQELADAYANRTIFEPKTGIPGGLLRHCREWAADFSRAAKQANSLAEMHEILAQRVSHEE
jgi:hypothetical protein